MAETAVDTKSDIGDVGIDEGARRLTPERIETVIRKMLKTEAGARLKTYVDTCVHCGLCADGCHFYLSHDNDPTYMPAGKVKQTLWEIIKKKGRVDVDFLKRASEIAHTPNATCAGAAPCTVPSGIDVAYMMLFVRRICHFLGITPQYIQDTAHSHSATMNQMWVKEDEWIDTLFLAGRRSPG